MAQTISLEAERESYQIPGAAQSLRLVAIAPPNVCLSDPKSIGDRRRRDRRELALAETCRQYVLRLGRYSSVDDVLINTIGAVLAALVTRRWWARRIPVGRRAR